MRTIGACLLVLGFVVEACGDISIRVIKPTENGLSGDPLTVIAVVESTFELQSVRARVGDREVELVFSEEAYYEKGEARPGWTGEVSLSGLAKGSQTVTVTAEDALGSSASKEVGFIFNGKPIIAVEGVLSESVATPMIPVKVSSSDDDAEASHIEIWGRSVAKESLVFTGGEVIDQEVDLSDFDHSSVTLRFDAVDSAGQVTSEERLVWVESNPRLVHLRSVGGRIWDVEPDRILYLEGENLRIQDVASGHETLIVTGQRPWHGFLTLKGAIFVGGESVTSCSVFDFRDGQLVQLGRPNSALSLKVRGNYAIWNENTTLVLRDLVSGVNTIVTAGSGNWRNDVTAGGVVVYWSYPGYQVFRYEQGNTLQLTDDADLWNTYPLTDGVNVVYRKHKQDSGMYAIAMHGPSGETILAEARPREPFPERDYEMNNGWIAFTKSGTSGELQVWTRSPSGELEQRSVFGTSSYIEALSPEGEVIFINGETKYLSVPEEGFFSLGCYPTTATPPYPSLPTFFWQDGEWLMAIGRSLFALDMRPPSIGVFNPGMTSGGEFGLEVNAVNVRKVTIQVSSDLKTWEDVATKWVLGGVASFVDASAKDFPGRFYRAKGLVE